MRNLSLVEISRGCWQHVEGRYRGAKVEEKGLDFLYIVFLCL